MLTIGIFMIILAGAVQVTPDATFEPICEFSKNINNGYIEANCTDRYFQSVPVNIVADVEVLDLRRNYIGKLTNDCFTIYTDVKILLLSFNQLHTIEAGSLEVLRKLKTLDLTQNALMKVPAGLPKTLIELYLGGNPIVDTWNLDRVVGLQVLHLNRVELDEYPLLASKVVELDVSENARITYLDPIQLAETCKLTRLNITNNSMFPSWRSGAYCECRRVEKWACMHNIKLFGLETCPVPLKADRNGGDNDPKNENCTRVPEEAHVAFDACVVRLDMIH